MFSPWFSVSPVPPWFLGFPSSSLCLLLTSPETLLGFVENNVLSRLNSTSRCTLCAFESFQLQFIPASPELALCVGRFCLGCGSARLCLSLPLSHSEINQCSSVSP